MLLPRRVGVELNEGCECTDGQGLGGVVVLSSATVCATSSNISSNHLHNVGIQGGGKVELQSCECNDCVEQCGLIVKGKDTTSNTSACSVIASATNVAAQESGS